MNESCEGELRKQEAFKKVLASTDSVWKLAALDVIREVARRQKFFIVDEIRQAATAKQIGAPPSHAHWGALFHVAAKEGIIKKTYRYKTSKLKSNNAGVRNIWESLLFTKPNPMEV